MEIFYEDLMENFDNKNLREKLMQLVHQNKILIIKGLNSEQRYGIYRQMYYPLKFEKIIVDENTENAKSIDIRVFNCKIKQKEIKQKESNEEKTKETKETKNEDEYVLEDYEHSEEENSDDSGYISESEDSYLTDEDEQLTKLEDIGSQILERVVKNEKKIDKTKNRINLVIMFNIIGWIMLYTLDPVRVIYIRKTQCEAL